MHLRLVVQDGREDAAEAQRLVAQIGPHPVVAARGRVALVEDEIDDLEDRGQPRRQVPAARHLERHARLGQRPFRADDALRDGGLGHEKRARDFVGREPAEQAQRERRARFGRQYRVARHQDQPQQVVAHLVVHRGLEVGRLRACAERGIDLDGLVFPLGHAVPADAVDRAVLCRGHEPGARIVGNACLGPPLERGDERLLCEVFGQPDIAHDAHEAADEPGRLDPPDSLDRRARGCLAHRRPRRRLIPSAAAPSRRGCVPPVRAVPG